MSYFFLDVIIFFREHGKILLTGFVLALVLIAIVFAVPFKTTTVERTETYYETELTRQEVTVEEPYVAEEAVTQSEVLANGFYKVVPLGIVIPFTVERSDTRLVGYYENPITGRFAVTGLGDRIIWEVMGSVNEVNVTLQKGNYNAIFREDVQWGEDCFILLKLEWSNPVKITKYRTVTKYVEVPAQVQKEKIVQDKQRISLWRYIFN